MTAPDNNMGNGTVSTVRVKCPNLSCQRILAVPVSTRGKLVRCRQCATIVRIPERRAATDAPAADNKAA